MPSTRWRGALSLNDTIEIPISFAINPDNIAIENGEETFVINDVIHKDDSIIFRISEYTHLPLVFRLSDDGTSESTRTRLDPTVIAPLREDYATR